MSARKPPKSQRKLDQKKKRREKRKREIVQGPSVERGLVREPRGPEKMSVVLERFVEPYMDLVDSEDAMRRLMTVATLAWNTALLPGDTQQKTINEALVAGLPAVSRDMKNEVRTLIYEMIERKRTYFATNRRAIISFRVQDTGDSYYLTVLSTLGEPPLPG